MRLPAPGHWLGFARRLNPLAAESDAALLARFVASRDEAAFEALVQRHGPMVHAVCRRRLGPTADADDAFQAAFLVFARDAAKIANPAAVPGWLYRVAYLVALKAGGRLARAAASLPPEDVPMTDPPDAPAIDKEHRAVVDAELANLPEKYRTVIVLCLVEGKTNAEAAAALGVPVGTVDSRLSTARKRLAAKLVRRGVTLAGVAALDRLFDLPLAASPAVQSLIAATVRGVLSTLSDSTAAALSPAVTSLAHGVSIMSLTKFKLLAAVGLCLGLLGGTGAGVFYATAQEKPAAKAAADPAKPPAEPRQTSEGGKVTSVGAGRTAKTTMELDKVADLGNAEIAGLTLRDLLMMLSEKTGTTIRVDVAFFKQFGVENVYEKKIDIPVVKNLTVRDILEEALAQVAPAPDQQGAKTGLRVKGGQIILGRGSVPLHTPGRTSVTADAPQVVDEKTLAEVLHGPVVGVAADNLPLADLVSQLREQTGANIVVDARVKEKMAQPVTLTVNDTRLMTVLKIAGDMCELAPAVVDNVYYLTTPENAAGLLQETYMQIYGPPQPAGPPTTAKPAEKK
jgi:RNA polymerase sigma factor (sigma-70 family)